MNYFSNLKSLFEFDKKKAIFGAILSVIAFIICSHKYTLSSAITFSAVFLIAGILKLKNINKSLTIVLNIIWALFSVFILAVSCTFLTGDVVFFNIGPARIFLNIACILFVAHLLMVFTGKWRLSFSLTLILLAILLTVNDVIFEFRGKELYPLDFLSFSTALNVASQYTINFHQRLGYLWLSLSATLFAQFSLPEIVIQSKLRFRSITAIIALTLGISMHIGSADIPIKTWYEQGSSKNGYFLNFYLAVRDSFISKPNNYSPDLLQNYALAYENEPENEVTQTSNTNDTTKKPNIIVIMDESFSDLRLIGDLRTNKPITPFIDSLSENTIRGHALTSVFGGNTANAEFEFLTNHSMAFLPDNSVPYQQYIKGDLYTFAWLMRDYGYTSIATHPYYDTGWCRKKIYPQLGFSESTFIDSYPQQNMLRKYVSDREMFEFMINKINEKKDDGPFFLFGITMQNHGSYTYEGDNYTKTVELEEYNNDYPLAEQYLSVLSETDSAMEYFINEISNMEEETIVLFFGDHYPKIEEEFYEELNGGPFETIDREMLKYTVPFFIWANYDIPESTIENTSLNYLSLHLLRTAELKLSPYMEFISEIEKDIPAINALGYYSSKQQKYIRFDDKNYSETEILNRYSILQYNNLFDQKNRNFTFFGQYVKP